MCWLCHVLDNLFLVLDQMCCCFHDAHTRKLLSRHQCGIKSDLRRRTLAQTSKNRITNRNKLTSRSESHLKSRSDSKRQSRSANKTRSRNSSRRDTEVLSNRVEYSDTIPLIAVNGRLRNSINEQIVNRSVNETRKTTLERNGTVPNGRDLKKTSTTKEKNGVTALENTETLQQRKKSDTKYANNQIAKDKSRSNSKTRTIDRSNFKVSNRSNSKSLDRLNSTNMDITDIRRRSSNKSSEYSSYNTSDHINISSTSDRKMSRRYSRITSSTIKEIDFLEILLVHGGIYLFIHSPEYMLLTQLIFFPDFLEI